jgi:hypothetical protein
VTQYRVMWFGRDSLNESAVKCNSLEAAREMAAKLDEKEIYAHIEELPDKTWAEFQAEGFLGKIADRWRRCW